MYVVTTPQAAAQRVAQRSAYAARKLKLSVRGVIENMSWFRGDDGTRYEIFGSGGGELLARDLGVALLGQIPWRRPCARAATPEFPWSSATPRAKRRWPLANLPRKVAAQGPARVYRQELRLL